jgi:hypothetical protein
MCIMNRTHASLVALSLATLCAAPALAQSKPTPLTRAQVKAELATVQRTGDILADTETGKKANEVNPKLYPPKVSMPARSRSEIKAELADAQRTGDILGNTETDQKLNEIYPGRYPSRMATAGKSRAEVKSDLADARRNGDLLADFETGRTLRDINPSRYAGMGNQ